MTYIRYINGNTFYVTHRPTHSWMEMRINIQDHKVHLLKELLEDLPFITIESTKEQVLQDTEKDITTKLV